MTNEVHRMTTASSGSAATAIERMKASSGERGTAYHYFQELVRQAVLIE
jgi:hypothetical protein